MPQNIYMITEADGKKSPDLSVFTAEIKKRMSEKSRVFVGIDGMSGAGKTTLAEKLSEIYDCNIFHADDYFLRPEQKTARRLAEVGGNIDYERLKAEITDNKFSEIPFYTQKYDCKTQSLSKPFAVTPKKLTVIEGSYSLHSYFGDVYDVKIILKITPQEQIRRIRERNGDALKRFLEEWIPKENAYLQRFFGEDL